MGLAVCDRIVRLVGGRIEVNSQPNKGSSFRVVLRPADTAPRLRETVKQGEKMVSPDSRRVLVIDDEVAITNAIRRMLRQHQVDIANDAQTALSLIENHTYDLVLCDLMMPDVSGMDLYHILLETEERVAKSMIFMSGGVFSAAGQEFVAKCDNRFIDKPFSVDVIRALAAEQRPAIRD